MSGYFGNDDNLANQGGNTGHGGDVLMGDTDRAGLATGDMSTIATAMRNHEGKLDLKTIFKYVIDNVSPLFTGAAD
jgi:hypothetical protein